MAGRPAVLSIRIIADGKQAGREFRETNKAVADFDDGLRQASVASGAAVAGIGALAYVAGNAASSLQQAAGAVESVYGSHAAGVKQLADQAAENVGLAESQYLQMSAVLGAQLKNMGTPMEQLAGQTNDLVTLGADLAAMFGGTTADAVDALSSLLRGERDPIERYGVSIKQADVNARVAAMGLSGLEGEAKRTAETQATLALLTEQTAAAQGQFAREADTAAGSQQRANAAWQDALATLGEQLLPIMADGANVLADLAGWAAENSEVVTVLVSVLGGLAGAVLLVNGALSAYRAIAAIATAAQIAWNVAMMANPLGLVVTAILLVIAIIVTWIANWEEVGRIAGEVVDNIVGWIQGLIGWIGEAIGWVGSLFGAAQGTVEVQASSTPIEAEPMAARAMAFTTAADELDPMGADTGSTWAAAAAAPIAAATAGGDTYNFDLGSAIDVDGTARAIEDVMKKHERRTGRPTKGGGNRWRS